MQKLFDLSGETKDCTQVTPFSALRAMTPPIAVAPASFIGT